MVVMTGRKIGVGSEAPNVDGLVPHPTGGSENGILCIEEVRI